MRGCTFFYLDNEKQWSSSLITCFNSAQYFLHICGSFVHIFISHTTLSAQNRDGLSHAWLFELSRVNVINVHDYNAELQQCFNVCYCFLFVERQYRVCAGLLIKYKVPCCEGMACAHVLNGLYQVTNDIESILTVIVVDNLVRTFWACLCVHTDLLKIYIQYP